MASKRGKCNIANLGIKKKKKRTGQEKTEVASSWLRTRRCPLVIRIICTDPRALGIGAFHTRNVLAEAENRTSGASHLILQQKVQVSPNPTPVSL